MNTVSAIMFLLVAMTSARYLNQQISVSNITNSSIFEFVGAIDQVADNSSIVFNRGFVVDTGNLSDSGSVAALLFSQFQSASADNAGTVAFGLNSIEANVNATQSDVDVNALQLAGGSGASAAYTRIQQLGAVSSGNSSESSFAVDIQNLDVGTDSVALSKVYGDGITRPDFSFSNLRICTGNQCP